MVAFLVVVCCAFAIGFALRVILSRRTDRDTHRSVQTIVRVQHRPPLQLDPFGSFSPHIFRDFGRFRKGKGIHHRAMGLSSLEMTRQRIAVGVRNHTRSLSEIVFVLPLIQLHTIQEIGTTNTHPLYVAQFTVANEILLTLQHEEKGQVDHHGSCPEAVCMCVCVVTTHLSMLLAILPFPAVILTGHALYLSFAMESAATKVT